MTWRGHLRTLNGALLALVGAAQALGDLASYSLGIGPLGARLRGDPGAIGFFEAHALAMVLGVLLVRTRREPGAGWNAVAAVIHLVLGGANLLFWTSFERYGMVTAGIVATTAHGVLFALEAGAAVSAVPALWSGPGVAFRWSALVTLAAGVALHGTSLAMGRDAFVARVFTPAVDAVLAVPMTFAGISGWLVLRRARHRTWWSRAPHLALLVYFTISIPIHLQTIITRRTDYVLGFPEWYSVPVLAVMVAAGALVLSLRFGDPTRP